MALLTLRTAVVELVAPSESVTVNLQKERKLLHGGGARPEVNPFCSWYTSHNNRTYLKEI